MIGGIIGFLGLGLSAFANSLVHLYVTFGILTGTLKDFEEVRCALFDIYDACIETNM